MENSNNNINSIQNSSMNNNNNYNYINYNYINYNYINYNYINYNYINYSYNNHQFYNNINNNINNFINLNNINNNNNYNIKIITEILELNNINLNICYMKLLFQNRFFLNPNFQNPNVLLNINNFSINLNIFDKYFTLNNLLNNIFILLILLKSKYGDIADLIINNFYYFVQFYKNNNVLNQNNGTFNLIKILSGSSNVFFHESISFDQIRLKGILNYLVDIHYELSKNLFGATQENHNNKELEQFMETYNQKISSYNHLRYIDVKSNFIYALFDDKPFVYYCLFKNTSEVVGKMGEILYRIKCGTVNENSKFGDFFNMVVKNQVVDTEHNFTSLIYDLIYDCNTPFNFEEQITLQVFERTKVNLSFLLLLESVIKSNNLSLIDKLFAQFYPILQDCHYVHILKSVSSEIVLSHLFNNYQPIFFNTVNNSMYLQNRYTRFFLYLMSLSMSTNSNDSTSSVNQELSKFWFRLTTYTSKYRQSLMTSLQE